MLRTDNSKHSAGGLVAVNDLVFAISERLKGGKGSGFYGHAGRPGERGGSAPNKGGMSFGKADPMNSPEFKRWFKKSKVVDKNGKPLVVYHGTNEDFYEFDLSRAGFLSVPSRKYLGEHHFFTASSRLAGHYAETHAEDGSGANIMPVYLSIQRPLVLQMSDANIGDVTGAITDAIAKGKDGVILKHTVERRLLPTNPFLTETEDVTTYIVFDPRKIKSVFNNGNFDPKERDITKERSCKRLKGGKGSGYFGHAGRPGKVGGSSPKNGVSFGKDRITELRERAGIYSDDPNLFFSYLDITSNEWLTDQEYAQVKKHAIRMLDDLGEVSRDDSWELVSLFYHENNLPNKLMDAIMRFRSCMEKEQAHRFKVAISMGNVTPDHVNELGYNDVAKPQGQRGWETMPDELYHTTTNLSAVMGEGLRTKQDRGVSGTGLGGGEDDVICFSANPKYCREIERALRERWYLANGKITLEDLDSFARQGYCGTGKNFSAKFRHLFEVLWGDFDVAVESLKTGKRRRFDILTNKMIYEPLTDADKTSILINAHNAYLAEAQEAGGHENPMFMFQDFKAFAKLDIRQFATVRARPIKRTRGYYMGDAEHEWRTGTGRAVMVVKDLGFFPDSDDIMAVVK